MKEYIKKVCLCGDPAVGKTSLIRRFVKGKYDEKYITTLGSVISKKFVKFPKKGFGVNMQVWDISGQSEFKRTHASAFKNSQGALAVCDVLRQDTALNLYEWLRNLRTFTKYKIPVIILVNKFDLVGDNKIAVKKINMILNNINYPIFTTSAKTGHNVEMGFRILAESIAPVPENFPDSVLELVAMPEIFENPYALLDYVLARYSNTFGDQELSMHMIRSKVEASGNDFNKMPREETISMINKLTEIINNFKGEDEAMKLRADFMEAYKRCTWN